MPEVRVVERYVPLPADLTDVQPVPPVPGSGSALDLLDWAMGCAASAAQLNQQMRALRELESN